MDKKYYQQFYAKWNTALTALYEAMDHVPNTDRRMYHITQYSEIEKPMATLEALREEFAAAHNQPAPRSLMLPHVLPPGIVFIRLYRNVAYSNQRVSRDHLLAMFEAGFKAEHQYKIDHDLPLPDETANERMYAEQVANITASPYERFVIRYPSNDYRLKAYTEKTDALPIRLTMRKVGVITQGEVPPTIQRHTSAPTRRRDRYAVTHTYFGTAPCQELGLIYGIE